MSSIINQFSYEGKRINLNGKIRTIVDYNSRTKFIDADWSNAPMDYLQKQEQETLAGAYGVPTIQIPYRKRLELESNSLKKKAADIDTVIEMFDRNPDLEKMLDAMRRLGV